MAFDREMERGFADGEPRPTAELLPAVYDELRRLAACKLSHEGHGLTLDATSLVHEAYLRLMKSRADAPGEEPRWDSPQHLLAAAAEAMRRILVEHARRKKRLKHGHGHCWVNLAEQEVVSPRSPCDLLAMDDALERLAAEDALAAELVKLRYYAGLSVAEAGQVLGLSRAGAFRHFSYAKAWLRCALHGGGDGAPA
jgi:RNA polymerase sigma factor (TIGR02999 family)